MCVTLFFLDISLFFLNISFFFLDISLSFLNISFYFLNISLLFRHQSGRRQSYEFDSAVKRLVRMSRIFFVSILLGHFQFFRVGVGWGGAKPPPQRIPRRIRPAKPGIGNTGIGNTGQGSGPGPGNTGHGSGPGPGNTGQGSGPGPDGQREV